MTCTNFKLTTDIVLPWSLSTMISQCSVFHGVPVPVPSVPTFQAVQAVQTNRHRIDVLRQDWLVARPHVEQLGKDLRRTWHQRRVDTSTLCRHFVDPVFHLFHLDPFVSIWYHLAHWPRRQYSWSNISLGSDLPTCLLERVLFVWDNESFLGASASMLGAPGVSRTELLNTWQYPT